MKAFQAAGDAVAAEGLDHLFAVMGDANQDLIVDLGERHGVKLVHAHHEAGAVGMADGYARFSGKPGLASVTQGPGYTNATTSLVAARLHRTPPGVLAGHASFHHSLRPAGNGGSGRARQTHHRGRRPYGFSPHHGPLPR
jgi:acetolactate synthase-1/2/3 large subunit